mmetsp:Transcript_62142/g.201523  ORF Transcript_62142/g.201523 Transcript_62142/m.201523 type:complete len:217 (+) Transcript_62142:1058-1708(+)
MACFFACSATPAGTAPPSATMRAAQGKAANNWMARNAATASNRSATKAMQATSDCTTRWMCRKTASTPRTLLRSAATVERGICVLGDELCCGSEALEELKCPSSTRATPLAKSWGKTSASTAPNQPSPAHNCTTRPGPEPRVNARSALRARRSQRAIFGSAFSERGGKPGCSRSRASAAATDVSCSGAAPISEAIGGRLIAKVGTTRPAKRTRHLV